ncbi:MAG: DUF2905 domain-containing protein [Candidatus Pacebacteria bacterium]|nr:DUF2905 domain-containing protein [Candidatus Paceibacterota bacterium]
MVLEVGKILILFGIILMFLGFLLSFWQKVPILGELPGDIYIKKGNFIFIAPIGTSILVSLILWAIFYFFSKFFEK